MINKFAAIMLGFGLLFGTMTISNNVYAAEEVGKLIPSDQKFPPSSPPGLEKAGMTRVISSTTSEKGISDIMQKGCNVIHKLNQATSFFCPTQLMDTLEDVRPVKIYQTHDLWQVEQIQADRVWNELGFDGTGVKVAVLDTGVQLNHDELDPPGRGYSEISLTADFTGEGGAHLDYHGHGTHVSGIIAGNGLYNIQGTTNKATGVTDFKSPNLIVGKVCTSFGCPEDAILAGIAWAKNQGADVINMSLGGDLSTAENCDNDNDNIVNEVNNVASPISEGGSDIVVVISSGNDGNKNAVSYPGCASGAIAVGAVDINDNDTSFSNAGPAMDVVAPGFETLSSWTCNSSPLNSCSSTWYYYASGTSMSAPHVAGVVALMLDADPTLTVSQVKAALYSTAIPVGPNDGNGRVDAYAAVNSISNPNPLTDDDLDGYSSDVDCDDNNAAINPGANEVPYDGIDNDCLNGDLNDQDNDGFPSNAASGGTPDCEDLIAAINPGATDILDNGIDEDCDGSDATSGPTPEVYVVDLDGSVSGKKNLNFEVSITVNTPGDGITVEGYWSTNPPSLSTCITASGTCIVTYNTKVTTMSFEVSMISGNYNSDLNEDSESDSDGTLITITKDDGGGNGGGGSGGDWDCINKYNPKKCPSPPPE